MISEDAILKALRAHAGIAPAHTCEASLRKEIHHALRNCPDPARLLDAASAEWKALLETVLVPETWFFRNLEAFEALAEWVTGTWLPAHPAETLRVLSLPCATGEEPYSIAICLVEAGLPPERIRIRAGDLSEVSLARADEATYRRNSFRTGFDEARFGRYFDDLGHGERRVAAFIRELVGFDGMNLVDPRQPLPPSHVIFCRNALIYFGMETQREVVKRLHAALGDDGILFLGPVEPPVALTCGFASAKLPMAFACVKDAGRPAEPERYSPAPPPRRPRCLPPAVRKPTVPARPAGAAVAAVAAAPPAVAPVGDSLALARSLADVGNEAAAADVLERLAVSAVPSADFFCLRGVVSDALGEGELAETYYRKALYLDPAHAETLAHLALLCDLRGRQAAAAHLRRRANQHATP